MLKLRVRGTLVTLVLFTAVAVSLSVVQALTSNQANHKALARDFRNTGVLVVDGSDPLPPPPNPVPIPWPTQSA